MKRIDWNLLVLAAAGGDSLTPAQFQKVMFLLQKRCPAAIPGGYAFRPYNYGPFDAQVYADAEELEKQGLARISGERGTWRTFSATKAGLETAESVAREA